MMSAFGETGNSRPFVSPRCSIAEEQLSLHVHIKIRGAYISRSVRVHF